MKNSVVVIYILWTLALVAVGGYAAHKIFNKSNPKSLDSRFRELDRTLHEYP